jgi:hypothetical protein
MHELWQRVGQQGSLSGAVSVAVWRRAAARPTAARLPLPGRRWGEELCLLDFGGTAVAPELAYITARYAALAPFGKVAALLSELPSITGPQHASTVRNRTRPVGETVVQQNSADTAKPVGSVMIGLDGGYVRNRHGGAGHHFEVIAGKVIDAEGTQHRFAFVRNAPVAASEAFKQVLAAAGVDADTPATTVLCDGDVGLWQLQRAALPGTTVVLDWWHLAVRFEHALQAAHGLGVGTAEKHLADKAIRSLERATWRLWHGCWPGCRRKLAALCRWT